MSMEFCEHEDAVATALRRGSLDGPLLQHAAACPQCGELQLILRYLAEVMPGAEDMQPSGLIWWRAKFPSCRLTSSDSAMSLNFSRSASGMPFFATQAVMNAAAAFLSILARTTSPTIWRRAALCLNLNGSGSPNDWRTAA